MEKIFEDIKAERAVQDEQWGGAAHDDQHGPEDFLKFIRWQSAKFEQEVEAKSAEQLVMLSDIDNMARPRLVKIAALAVAAIESIDRKTK